MVDQSYLTAKPPKPGALRTGFNQTVMPALINASGAMEGGMERVAVTIRRTPTAALLIAAGLGFLLAQAGRLRA